MQPAKKDLQRGHAAGVGFRAARHAALMCQPVEVVVQILRADLANGRADPHIAAEQSYVAGKGLHRVDGETLVLHMPLKGSESSLQRRVAAEHRRPLIAFMATDLITE